MDFPLPIQVTANSAFAEILDELCVRFIAFLPEEELMSVERICFQIEEAHWYYEDFIREINTNVPNLHLRQFIHQMFNHVPKSLIAHIPLWKTESAFTDFMTYKTRVPVRGCIMLNTAMDHCVLVKGWKSGSSWSFPRGKIDKDEGDKDCAIREVLEETGFDLTGMVGEDGYIDINIREQDVRLYIAPGVPEDVDFVPKTRKEISKVAWHKLSELPGYSKKGQRAHHNIRQGKFFLVGPFIRELRKWISTSGKTWLARQEERITYPQENGAITTALTNEDQGKFEKTAPPPAPRNDSASGLKSLLGVDKAAEVVQHGHMTPAEQEEASGRLRAMLAGNLNNPQEGTLNGGNVSLPSTSSNPNVQALLSILQGSSSSSPPASQMPVPALLPPPPPNFVGHHPSQNQQLSHPGPPQYVGYASMPQQPRQPLAPVFQNSHMSSGAASGGWHQQPAAQPFNPPNSYHMPTPPPTSRYPPPPVVGQAQHQRQNSASHPNVPRSNSSGNHQQGRGQGVSRDYSPMANQPPPTPVEAFLPPPMPTRPPDPNQAGVLLSILKGTAVSPVPNAPHASSPAPPVQLSAAPAVPTTVLPVATEISMPNRPPTNPIALQAPPPPRGPKSQTPQRHGPMRQRGGTPSRPFTAAPVPQPVAPPSRPTTTQPHHKVPLQPPLRRGTPIVIDHYGTPKTPTVPTTNFDRRESVTGEQAKTLLAMFRMPTGAGSPAASPAVMDELVASSPEIDKRKHVVPAAGRLTTPSMGRPKPNKPAGRDREGLLAYLEGVAKSGGVAL